MSRKLNSYKGWLTAEQVAAGMTAAAENAAGLVADAELLLEKGRFATAVSLSALAIEESGKISILRSIAVAKSEDEVKAYWRDYRSHTRKNASWIFLELFANGARQLEHFKCMFFDDSDHTAMLDNLKQLGFYTDCLGKAHWARPKEVINEALARKIVSATKIMARPTTHSTREVELWIQHIGPVWKQEMALMKQAVIDWQSAMHKEGLSNTTADDMKNFVFGAP